MSAEAGIPAGGRVERLKDRIRATENPFLISILKHSPKYLGASVFSGVVALVMTKYYTHVFDPATYGVLALYITLFTYMQNVIGYPIITALVLLRREPADDAEGAEELFLCMGLSCVSVSLPCSCWAGMRLWGVLRVETSGFFRVC